MEENICFLYDDEYDDERMSVKEIKNIYSKIDDEISRKIFLNRFLFSFTNEHKCMRNVILSTETGRNFFRDIENLKDKNIYVYGAGNRGKRLIEMLPEIKEKKKRFCWVSVIFYTNAVSDVSD